MKTYLKLAGIFASLAIAAGAMAGAPTKNELLWAAVDKGDFSAVEKAIKDGANVNFKDKDGQSVLHQACLWSGKENYRKIVKLLLEKGADVNALYKGQTPLHFACLVSDPVNIAALISNKAKVNAQDLEGDTPLHNALFILFQVPEGGPKEFETNALEAAELLLKNGADATMLNRNIETALQRALHQVWDTYKMKRYQ